MDQYLLDANAARSYRHVYHCASRTAETNGPRLLWNAQVAAAVAAGQLVIATEAKVEAIEVVREWSRIAFADPTKYVDHRRTCCHYCWGVGFGYQTTPHELALAKADWAKLVPIYHGKKLVPVEAFDARGGDGFDPRKPPNPLCPDCFGEGISRIFVHDVTRLPPAERRMLAGIRHTEYGVELRFRDQDAALTNLAKHLGMFTERLLVDAGPTLEQMLGNIAKEHPYGPPSVSVKRKPG